MALAGVFLYLKEMYDRNIGGLADTLRPLFDKIRLFFGGMYMFITDGFISGPMAKQIQDPQHSGLLQFMIVLLKWGYRARIWVETFVDRVQGLITRLAPHMEEVGKTIDKIRNIIADVVGDVDGMTPTMDGVTNSANTAAVAITTLFGVVMTAFTVAGSVLTGFSEGFRNVFKYFEPTTDLIGNSVNSLREEYEKLIDTIGFDTADSDKWASFGEVLGTITALFVEPLAAGLGVAIRVGAGLIGVFTGVVEVIKGLFEGLDDIIGGIKALANGEWTQAWELFGTGFDKIWDGIVDGLGGIIDGIISMIGDLLGFLADVIMSIPDTFRPDFLTGVATDIHKINNDLSSEGVGAAIIDVAGNSAADAAGRLIMPWRSPDVTGDGVASEGGAGAGAAPSSSGGITQAELVAALKEAFMGNNAQTPTIVLQADGENLMTWFNKATRAANALGYGADQAEED
jgi:hypothetical protein